MFALPLRSDISAVHIVFFAMDKDQILDETLLLTEGYSYIEREAPLKVVVPRTNESIGIKQLPLRGVDQVRKIWVWCDIREGIISGTSPDQIADKFLKDGVASLPEALRPQLPLPPNIRMQLILHVPESAAQPQQGLGGPHYKFDVIKVYICFGALSVASALKLCRGEAFTTMYRDNQTWGLKKSLCLLLDKLPGVQVRWCTVVAKAGENTSKPDKWNPTPEQVTAGKEFLKRFFPRSGGELDQMEWLIADLSVTAVSLLPHFILCSRKVATAHLFRDKLHVCSMRC